ncbi:Mitochondrial pyruvate carrier 2 [Morella rubra]|uniref:Mitochondrial pyruvate carrier n=1 Tax=Morella rubra TaxID=262757 RepID=A0A6A1VPE3_9ROSI|nr:Mitochondrial pyruvate carrier 2 [Morella rubra]
MAASKLQAFLNHPAGPKTRLGVDPLPLWVTFFALLLPPRSPQTSFSVDAFCRMSLTVHFWAPTFKWGISIANIADFAKPPEKLSYPQQIAVTATGVIWSRYSTVIIPKNWNLFSVNVAMAATGIYQLSRKIRQDYFSEAEAEVAVAKE